MSALSARAVVLRALRRDATSWWAHRELRERGNVAEAVRREHASIRDDVRRLRTALRVGGFLAIGRGGATLYYDRGACVQRMHPGGVEAAQHLLPWIDTRTVPAGKLGALVALPMAEVGVLEREACPPIPDYMLGPGGLSGGFEIVAAMQPYGALDYCPPAYYAARAAELGATVGNWTEGGAS